MNKKLVVPFIVWILFLLVDMVSLIKGIQLHQGLRVAVAGIALIGITGFLYFIIRQTTKQLKPVRVRK